MEESFTFKIGSWEINKTENLSNFQLGLEGINLIYIMPLPKSSAFINRISARFDETDCTWVEGKV